MSATVTPIDYDATRLAQVLVAIFERAERDTGVTMTAERVEANVSDLSDAAWADLAATARTPLPRPVTRARAVLLAAAHFRDIDVCMTGDVA